MEDIMSFESDKPTPEIAPPQPRRVSSRRVTMAAVAVAVLAIGAFGGAAASRYIAHRHPQAVLMLQPAPIAQMKDASPVAIKGQVAEIFGTRFVVQDDSGRALVETGPRGEDGKLVTKGEPVTVQGVFDHGFIHAQMMTRADGATEAFGPPRPHHGPGGKHGPHGDRGPGGPGRGPGAGPEMGPDRGPPPPPAN
jgi:hypothetical protein